MSQTTLDQLLNQGLERISQALSLKSLYDVKVEFLGKNGPLSEAMKAMATLPKEEKPAFGKKANEVKKTFEEAYQARESALSQKELNEKLQQEKVDVSLPGVSLFSGSRHPVSLVIRESTAALNRLGFAVRTGPHIEEDWYNFEALNIPPDHPSRDMQDTFYVDDSHVLRTHTSPIQIRSMITSKPPLRVMAPGPVFRSDSDVTHSPNFHQIEGLLVDRKVSMAHLKATITFVLKELFGSKVEVRFRPSFFPFTEPSAEFDCSCPMCSGKGCRTCKQTGWIEIGGCGLVNPKVLEACKIDSNEWQGFAFGFGIERMAMIKYGIGDIRLFNENDLRFLRQFQK
jgi:phenylalanyl-tRNA synthetase alpha chain